MSSIYFIVFLFHFISLYFSHCSMNTQEETVKDEVQDKSHTSNPSLLSKGESQSSFKTEQLTALTIMSTGHNVVKYH